MRLLKPTIAIALAAASLAALPSTAWGCSCGSPSEDTLKRSDAAVNARLIDVRDPSEGNWPTAIYKYRVLRTFKNQRVEPGSELRVKAPASSPACGLPRRVGKRIGLFLERRDGVFTSNLCYSMPPRGMRKLAAGRETPMRTRCVARNVIAVAETTGGAIGIS